MPEKIEVNCATCGKAKKVRQYQWKASKSKNFFCDKMCRGKWQSNRMKGENHPLWNSTQVRCANCGKEKFINSARYSSSVDYFCNTKCQMEWRKTNWTGKNNPLFKKNITVNCAWCGKEKKVIPYLTIINNKFFCDKFCQGKYKSVHQSKENCGRWKGGKSFEPYGLEFDSKLKHKIKKRDGYLCRVCNSKPNNTYLHVHHIDYDKTNNKESNLITLCNSCHSTTNSNRESWLWYFWSLT